MENKIPGGVFDSMLSKARYPKELARRLNYLRRKHGCIFWDYPLLRPSSRVLIVFDSKSADAIARDDVLFARASEYWEDRDSSSDLYERLLGDSLYFSDGYHHQKRAKDYKKRISSKRVTAKFIEELMNTLTANDYEKGNYCCESLGKDVYRRFLEAYYSVRLTDEHLELVSASIRKAWDSRNKALACPYRLMKRKSTRFDKRLIDQAKSVLLSEMEQSQDVPSFQSGTSSVSLTHKYLVEEGLASGLSILSKLGYVLEKAREYIDSLDRDSLALLYAESSSYSPEDSLEELAQRCPLITGYTEKIISKVKPPVKLLKRVAVCDTVVSGFDLKRTTEVWIPTWTSRELVFGAGMYACKGEMLTTLITASAIHYLAIRKGEVIS